MMAGLQFCGQRGSLVWDVLKNPIFYNQKAENIVKKKVQSLQEILKKNRVSISIGRSAAQKLPRSTGCQPGSAFKTQASSLSYGCISSC
ncbi:MAG: hypothetical protein K9M08_05030, partial [Pirellula sp.]|nr:hypothetical protein [Pirellula sp.]